MKHIIAWLLYALAITPLVLTKSFFFPFISGKTLFIRIVVTLIYGVFLYGIIASTSFRDEVWKRLLYMWNTWFGKFMLAFVAILIVSTITAVNPYRAFFGDVERGEGLIGLLFFVGFFFVAYTTLQYKQWIRFFQITMGSGVILFIDMITEFASGIVRPASFTGNPIYLAAIYLFVLFASALVYGAYSPKNQNSRFWRMAALLTAGLSCIGIFITETRGVIAGLGIGGIALLAYFFIKGNHTYFFNTISLRKISGICFLVLIVGGVLFVSTRDAAFWNEIPGFDRLSKFTLNDATTQTRLISLGVSLHAINPAENSAVRTLVGWGPENFNIAYDTYFNPEYFRYEQLWFDRAHNKLMDVLVMHGILGFIAYMGIWITILWRLIRGPLSWRHGICLFFGVAYFVQNLFVFDSVSTYIVFFAFLAYCLFDRYSASEKNNTISGEKKKFVSVFPLSIPVGGMLIFFFISLVWWTIIPFQQMYQYISAIKNLNAPGAMEQLKDSLSSYSYVQELLRSHFTTNVRDMYAEKRAPKELLVFAIQELQEFMARESSNPRYYVQLGQAYDVLGSYEPQYFKESEKVYRAAIQLVPKRQDVRYLLGYNLSYQKRYDEAIALLQETVALDSRVAQSHFYLGMVLTAQGNKEAALHSFETLVELDPLKYKDNDSYRNALNFLGTQFLKEKNIPAAVRTQKLLQIIDTQTT